MIVAIDTSTLTLSLALLDGPTLVREAVVGPPTRLSQALPTAISDLVPLERISGFVVGLGPGSFTGLRISLACVKGLAYALRVPVAGASSLAAVQAEGPKDAHVLAAAVVKKGELYLRERAEERVVTPAEFASVMIADSSTVALGPGINAYKPQLEALGVPGDRLLESVPFPRAAELARLAKLPPRYDAQAVFALEPHYIRSSGAEDNPKFPPLPGAAPTARLK